jgi:hypothetical protein
MAMMMRRRRGGRRKRKKTDDEELGTRTTRIGTYPPSIGTTSKGVMSASLVKLIIVCVT